MTSNPKLISRKNRSRLFFLACGLALLAVGGGASAWQVGQRDRQMRDELLAQTLLLAQSIPLESVAMLDGSISDEQKPVYWRLKEQLMAAQRMDPDWEWIYLMGRRENGTVFFQMDSESADAIDASPPGLFYEEASPLLQGVFDRQVAATEGPISDRWGVWVSSFVPLVDPATGNMVTVVGIDVDAKVWRWQAAQAGIFPGLVVLSLLGILTAGYLLKDRRTSSGSAGKQRRWRHFEAGLAAATGVTLTLTASWLANRVEKLHRREAGEALAEIKTERVLTGMRKLERTEIEGLARFFEYSENVTPDEFRDYSGYLVRVPEVEGWGWATADANGGGYPLQLMVSAQDLSAYGLAEGADLGGREPVRNAIEKAVETRMPVATEVLSPEPGPTRAHRHALVFRPVLNFRSSSALKGLAVAVVDPAEFFRTVLGADVERSDFLSMGLYQLRPDGSFDRLASMPPEEGGGGAADDPYGDGWILVRPVLAFGNTYLVCAKATDRLVSLHSRHFDWIALVAGLFLTAVSAIAIGLVAHRREDMERMVEQRNGELVASLRRYHELAENSRTLAWRLDPEGLYTEFDGPAEEVLGYRLDEIAGKLHFYDLHPEEIREQIKEAARQIFASGQPYRDMINPVVAKSGEIVWMLSHGMPVVEADGTVSGYQGTDTDITARQKAEDELRLQSDLQRLLVDISSTYINLSMEELDAAIQGSLERLGRFFGADRAYLFDYDDPAGLCRNTHEWCAEGIQPQIESLKVLPEKAIEFAAQRHRRGETIHIPDVAAMPPGWGRELLEPQGIQSLLTVPLMSGGRCAGFVGFDSERRKHAYSENEQRLLAVFAQMLVGVRERKRAEDEMARLARENQESAARYKALIRASNTGAWEYDDATGHMWASPEYFAMLGGDPAGIDVSGDLPNIDVAWLNWLHPDDLERARAAFIDYIKNPDGFYEQTFRMRHADGRWRWILSRGQALRGADGQPTTVVLGTHIDVSAEKNAEQYREMGVQTLQILNQPKDLGDLLQELVGMFRERTGLDAASVRLENGGRYPYAAQEGLQCDFCHEPGETFVRGDDGGILRGPDGRLSMRSDCGLRLAGDSDDPQAPPTSGESAWTNDALELKKRQTGNADATHCVPADYLSIALVPIWVRGRIVGFLQFNDRRKGQFSREIVLILEGLAAHVGEALLRKRAEQDYRTLFHEMLEGFAVHEIVCDENGRALDYRFLAVNPAFERISGLKAAEIAGKTVLEVLPDTDPRLIRRYGRVALTGEPVHFEHYAAGVGRHFEVTAFRPAPNQFACIVNDITERKLAEVERERLTRAIEQSSENVVITDAAGTIQFVNPAFARITGYSREEALGQNPRLLKSGAHDAGFYARMWKTLKAGNTWEGEIVNRCKDGRLITELATISPVRDTDGQIVNYVAVKRDVSEQKKAEAALAQSEQNYRTLADAGHVLIWTSGPDKKLNFVNAPWLRFTGRPFAEIEGDGWRGLIHPEDRESFVRAFEAAFDRFESFHVEYRLRHADGDYRWIREEGSPRFDRSGVFLGYIGHGIDISDRKKAETEREQLQGQLLQAQKMESIGRLAGGIAHDFNNMLQAILGYAEMVLDQIPADAPVRADVLEIQKSAKRSADLTRQLQTFARKQAISPKVLDFNDAVEGMSGMLRRLIGEAVVLAWKPGRGVGQVKMDPTQVDQIVANLCINASDAIGKSGQIVLRTRAIDLAAVKHTPLGEIAPGPYVMLSVQDNGCGMDPDVVEHIFEPFYTTKRTGKGTGLGLATVYGIVKQNRGGIRVKSQPGKGSLFEIFLPRCSEKAATSKVLEGEAPPSRGNESILLVEDEPNILQATRRMLESLGYRVLATVSANEAIQTFGARGEGIDLLVTDVVMPEMNGPALVQRLKDVRPGLKHLYMSGYTANLIAEQGVKEEGTYFLAKPFSRQAIARKVRQALDGA